MIAGIALLVGGVALYALAGSALSARLAHRATSRSRRRTSGLLLLALGGALAVTSIVWGIDVVDRTLTLQALGLATWTLAGLSVAPIGLLAGGLLLLAALPPSGGGGHGGSGPDDLPPPPDPDGPDGWTTFERQFRAYAAAHDARNSRLLVH